MTKDRRCSDCRMSPCVCSECAVCNGAGCDECMDPLEDANGYSRSDLLFGGNW